MKNPEAIAKINSFYQITGYFNAFLNTVNCY